jgi:hypothetical protein
MKIIVESKAVKVRLLREHFSRFQTAPETQPRTI